MVLRGESPLARGLTRVFGNGNADSITFDQTLLGGNTRAYGCGADGADAVRPGGDGEDTFTVYKLQSMATGRRSRSTVRTAPTTT